MHSSGPQPNGVIPLIHAGGTNDLRTEGTHRTRTKVGSRMECATGRDGWVGCPLLKVPLPRYLQQGYGAPQEDDRQLGLMSTNTLCVRVFAD